MPSASFDPADRPGRRWTILAVAVIAGLSVLAIVPFLGSVRGDFVYDDVHQVVNNPLIQDDRYIGRALTSDVWAFKGDRDEAWSNYWRPTFVAWNIVNHRLFGLESTLGWHLANLLLHAVVSLLAFAWLRRLRLGLAVSFAVAALFAVHPVHVESVVWIAGAPDLLAAAGMLGALVVVPLGRASPGRWIAALALTALALGAKEITVVLPVLVGLSAWLRNDSGNLPARDRLLAAGRTALPFALLAGLFLVVRWQVLGLVEIETRWSLGWLGMAANGPRLVLFYLGQCLWPSTLGPSYPLRAFEVSEIGWLNFWMPTLCLAVGLALVGLLARRRPVAWLGATLFALPLLPALNIDAFIQEQLVHDRYLYLPLLGLLLLLVLAARELLSSLPHLSAKRIGQIVVALAVVAALPLALQTARYAKVWTSELALWERAVAVDPGSAFNQAEYGVALLRAGRPDEARLALDRALAIEPVTNAYLNRADLAIRQGLWSDAERDLNLVRRHLPSDHRSYALLARVQLAMRRPDQARETLLEGRRQAPTHWCALTADLAVVHYQLGDRTTALGELEACRERLDSEPSLACLRSLFRLASLYQETGQTERAKDAFEELTRRTSGRRSAGLEALHQQARRALAPRS